MKVYRFCSQDEANLLSEGKELTNHTDHYREGRGGSTSRGFCLTDDSPKVAWEYLKGIVAPGVCCAFEIPREYLTESHGKYAGGIITTAGGDEIIKSTLKREWCIEVLKPEWLKRIIPLESFVPRYELAGARWLYRHKVRFVPGT